MDADSFHIRSGTRMAGAILLIGWALISREAAAQQPDAASVIALVDSAVRARVDNVLAFTDIEHYRVYRGDDENHPVAEMTARDSYQKGVGKTYTILSQSGSSIVQHFGLKPLIDNEEAINKPGSVEHSWFTSANYEMRLKPGVERVNGRECYALTVTPKQTAPNMVDGTLWVDTNSGDIVKIEGIASKSPSPFAGTTHMMRQYVDVDGYAMATHARAESKSLFFGRTVVVIDYSYYHLQVRESRAAGK